MLNIKDVTKLLSDEGITNSEQMVLRWIREGKIKAEEKVEYTVNPSDIIRFIIETNYMKQMEQSIDTENRDKLLQENMDLKEELEVLKSALRIEQAKVRSLKKMLKAEYDMSDTKSLNPNLILGLDYTADSQIIKREYKKILKVLHPDRGGDERLFKVFNEHYSKVK